MKGIFSGRYRDMAATFDGTNDYMLRGADLTGIADGKAWTYSFWVKMNGGDGGTQIWFMSNALFASYRYSLFRNASNVVVCGGRNSAGTTICNLQSTATVTADGKWHHVLASVNLATPTGKVYIDDVDVTSAVTLTNDTVDFTTGNTVFGADNGGNDKLNASIANFWFNTSFLDLTVTANRRLFIDGALTPVYLGANGERPTGSSPLMYQKVSLGGVAANFATNNGTGGNFSITGSLDLVTGPTG